LSFAAEGAGSLLHPRRAPGGTYSRATPNYERTSLSKSNADREVPLVGVEGKGSAGSMGITITTHLWQAWSEIAIQQLHLAQEARSRAQAASPEGEGLVAALIEEWHASMISIAACSHALDAVYGAVKRPAGITDEHRGKWTKNRTARAGRILETLTKGFAIGSIQRGLGKDLSWLFRVRRAQLHFDEKPQGPMPHPTGMNTALEQVIYSLESAERAVEILLRVLKTCAESPKPPLEAWAASAREPVRLLVESVGKST
jgi:hypothetical protein